MGNSCSASRTPIPCGKRTFIEHARYVYWVAQEHVFIFPIAFERFASDAAFCNSLVHGAAIPAIVTKMAV